MKKGYLKNIPILTIMAALLLCGACRHVDNMEYARYTHLPAEGWDAVDIREFTPLPADTAEISWKLYDVTVMLRYGLHPKARSLTLLATTMLNDSVMATDTVTFRLTDTSGNPVGKGSGFAYELTDTIMRAIKLSPDMRIELSPVTAKEGWCEDLAVGVAAMRTTTDTNNK